MPVERRFADIYFGETNPMLVGTAFFNGFGSTLSTTFSYAEEWLSSRTAFPLGPHAELTQRTTYWQGLPPFLRDCSPDRWGRTLILREARSKARRQNFMAAALDDVDYLVGVDDWARMGAYRIRYNGGKEFVGANTDIPKLIMLPDIAYAVSAYEAEEPVQGPLKTLLAVGSSALGGARPKATVSKDASLYIAKFPSKEDMADAAKWEAWALSLARFAGCSVPEIATYPLGHGTVLLSKRFDRVGQERIAYLSGHTLIGQGSDMSPQDYADLGDAMMRWCAMPSGDLIELFKRVVISVAIHNTDDHMRNHGFLHSDSGWFLAPLFDVNPNFDLATERVTGIYGFRGPSESDGLPLLAQSFGLTSAQTSDVIEEIHEACRISWPFAEKLGCKERELDFVRTYVNESLARILKSTGLNKQTIPVPSISDGLLDAAKKARNRTTSERIANDEALAEEEAENLGYDATPSARGPRT